MTRVAQVARPRPPRGRAARRPVHRQRHGRAPRRLAAPQGSGDELALREDRAPASEGHSRMQESRSTTPPRAPRAGTQVIGELPNLLGPGMTGQMTLLLDGARGAGLLRRRLLARGLDPAKAGRPARREHLGPLRRHPGHRAASRDGRALTRADRRAGRTHRAPCAVLHDVDHVPRLRCAPCRADLTLALPALRGRSSAYAARAATGSPGPRAERVAASLSLTARNIGRRYVGDRALFATVSPGVPGRDTAAIRFALNRRATVTLEAVRTAKRATSVAWKTTGAPRAGDARAHVDARPGDARRLVRDAPHARAAGGSHDGARRARPPRSPARRRRSSACSGSRRRSCAAPTSRASRWSCGSWPTRRR